MKILLFLNCFSICFEESQPLILIISFNLFLIMKFSTYFLIFPSPTKVNLTDLLFEYMVLTASINSLIPFSFSSHPTYNISVISFELFIIRPSPISNNLLVADQLLIILV